MNTPALAAHKGSHLRLIDGAFMPSRLHPGLTDTWGKPSQDHARAPLPQRARGNRRPSKFTERGTIEQAMAILGLPKRTIQEKPSEMKSPEPSRYSDAGPSTSTSFGYS
jgi:hypothetical protein